MARHSSRRPEACEGSNPLRDWSPLSVFKEGTVAVVAAYDVDYTVID